MNAKQRATLIAWVLLPLVAIAGVALSLLAAGSWDAVLAMIGLG
jgi:hypothetical protein